MKKIFLIVLSVFLLSGCTPAVHAPAPVKHSAETLTIKDETGIYMVDIKYPKLDYTDEINQMIKDKMNTEIELFADEAASLELTAEEIEEYVYGKSGLWIDYTVYLLSEDYISVAFETSVYNSGAAHPYSYTEVFNYDVKNNKDLLLVDMFVPDTMFWEAISATVIPKIKFALYEDEMTDDDWIDEGAGPDPKNFIAFNITEDGFVFHFDPYQVAAYAAGPQRIEVNFEELGAILMPEWQ